MCVSNIIYAQECGMDLLQMQMDFMDDNRDVIEATDVSGFNNVTIDIPIVAHIVRTSIGTGGLQKNTLNTAIGQLNSTFGQVNFRFNLCYINYIDNDDFYSGITKAYKADTFMVNPSNEYNMALPHRADEAVNVFFVPTVSTGGCGWSSFPSYVGIDKDWTVIRNDCADNGSTLAHEIGHYFNLYHTHECWGGDNCELVDRSNCGPNIGDELCDTPADPDIRSCVTSDCEYDDECTETDANGDLYTPDVNNVMSYSRKHCRTYFSSEQRVRMQQSYANHRTNLAHSCICADNFTITNSFYSDSEEEFKVDDWIESTATINIGADVSYQAGNIVRLQTGFKALEGCIFEASISPCIAASKSDSGSNSLDKRETAILDKELSSNIYPNPTSSVTNIVYDLPKESNVSITIFDGIGKEVALLQESTVKEKGRHNLQFDASDLPIGLYHVRIQSNDFTSLQKIIIAR